MIIIYKKSYVSNLKTNKKFVPFKNIKSLNKKDFTFKKKYESQVGKVYRGYTKFINREPKHERFYVVVEDEFGEVRVSKLKSIKKFDENGKNADKHLVEINQTGYNLPKRTGVDRQVFSKNRISHQNLRIDDNSVFYERKPRFSLSNRDKYKVLHHTNMKKKPNWNSLNKKSNH